MRAPIQNIHIIITSYHIVSYHIILTSHHHYNYYNYYHHYRGMNRAILGIDGIYSLNATTSGMTQNHWNMLMCNTDAMMWGREMIAFGVYRPSLIIKDMKLVVKICPIVN